MSDLIDRQSAIDMLSLGKEILSRVLDDIDVVGTDREKYSWGLELIESNIKDIEELLSAQPEIISTPSYTVSVGEPMEYAPIVVRCKDCKHYDGRPCGIVDWYNTADDFCSRAERRTDEQNKPEEGEK